MSKRTVTHRPVESTVQLSLADRLVAIEKFDKLARRIAKLGGPTPTITFSEPYVINDADECGFEFRHYVVDATVTGFVTQIDGFEFAATLDHEYFNETGQNIVSSFEGCQFVLDPKWQTAAPHCDHCGLNRNRKSTIVLSNGTETIQVGRGCVLEFIGVDPTNATFILGEGTFDGEGSGETWVDSDTVIGLAFELTRLVGFRRSIEFNSTRDAVSSIIFARDAEKRTKALRDAFGDKLDKLDVDGRKDAIAECRAWLADQTSGSDYIRNLQLVVSRDVVRAKDLGLLVSLPASWSRQREEWAAKKLARESEAARKAALPQSEYFGNVGDKKVVVHGTVTAAFTIESNYGSKRIIEVTTADGNVAKTFSTSGWVWELESGDEVEFFGTITEHSVYRGVKQTIFTRTKGNVIVNGVKLPTADSQTSRDHAYGDHDDARHLDCHHCVRQGAEQAVAA